MSPRRVVLGAALLGAVGASAVGINSQYVQQSISAGQLDYVTRVVDGDTIYTKKQSKSIRILGINTPETVDPRKPVECGGPEATQFAKQVIPPGAPVRLVRDFTQSNFDIYNRPLRYVEFRNKDGEWEDYSAAAARAGHARSYVFGRSPVLRHDTIKNAELFAQANRLGLWGHC